MTRNKIIKIIGIILVVVVVPAVFFVAKKNVQKNGEKESMDFLVDFKTEKIQIENVPFDMPAIEMPVFPENYCNIRDYGAIEGGREKNTEPIKKAIEDCNRKGGGKVIFPVGKWLTGPIHFKSNINIHLEKDAELIFTTNFDDYLPAVFSRFQGMEYYNFSPPIYANDCQNIAITGEGKLFGNGEVWAKWAHIPNSEIRREELFEMSKKNIPVEKRVFSQDDSGLRPSFIQFVNCKNILIEGLTIGDGPMWTIHPMYSENIVVRNVKIETYSINTDGIAIDSSKNVLIENSTFSTGDDSISIKSGLEDEGIRVNRPSENIIIRNCNFIKGHSAAAVGSEMSGGVRNVLFEKCFLGNMSSGFRIKTMRSRGGFVENIWLDDIKADRIEEEMIVFNFQYTSALKNKSVSRIPALKNIHIKNIKGASLGRAIDILEFKNGIMEDVSFENIELAQNKKSELKYAKNIIFKNVFLKIKKGSVLAIEGGRDIIIENLKCENDGGKCLDIKGERTYNINIEKANLKEDSVFVEEKAKSGVIY